MFCICRKTSLLRRLHGIQYTVYPPEANSTHSVKSPFLFNQYSNLNAPQNLETVTKCQYSYDWKPHFNGLGVTAS